jgi:negative regulator of sigma E activity
MVLGVIMSLGYPAEREVRRAWRHWETPNTPLTAAAEVLAVMMVVLGHSAQQEPSPSDDDRDN